MTPSIRVLSCLLALSCGVSSVAKADQVLVAVAANFATPLQEICDAFAKDTQHKAVITSGATGKLYAQVQNGAPFELMVSADSKTPTKMVEEKLAVAGTQFTYAVGKLVLWSAEAGKVDQDGKILESGAFKHLAIANPKTAPYGQAAMEVLKLHQLDTKLQPKIVQGESIAQTKMFVDSGNAELGFVALSQVYKDGKIAKGSAWLVPADSYQPIYQDAVLLNKGLKNPAAQALLDYLKSAKAKAIIERYGYAQR